MTMNQDRSYNAATFFDKDDARLQLWRKTSTPEVGLHVTDYVAELAVRFNLNRPTLDQLIAPLQLESELLAAPAVGERRRAPSDDPELTGCEVIRVDPITHGGPLVGKPPCHWFVYRGSLTGTWATDAEVADWTVLS